MAAPVRALSPVSMTERTPSALSSATAWRRIRRAARRAARSGRRALPPTITAATVLPSAFELRRRAPSPARRTRARLAAWRGAPTKIVLAVDRAGRRPGRAIARRPRMAGATAIVVAPWPAPGWPPPADGSSRSRPRRPARAHRAPARAERDDVGDARACPRSACRSCRRRRCRSWPRASITRRPSSAGRCRAPAESDGGDRRRHRDHQRAGAADQQQRQRPVDPDRPFAAEERAAARSATSSASPTIAGM